MEFSSFTVDACGPATGKGVIPGLIPIPNVDPDELEEAAGRFLAIGEAIEESGEDITGAWASLTGIYTAPEAEDLLSALDPISSEGSAVATGVRDAADALMTFAETARELKERLEGLKAEAEAFRTDVGWDEEWLDDEDKREQNNELNNRIARAVAEYEEAERDCANKIGEHYDGTWFTGHSDKASFDQTKSSGDRDWQVYGSASAREDQPNPWGGPVDAPTGLFEDGFWGVADLAIGAVVGLGLATGLYRDGQAAYPFGTEHGQNIRANWDETKDSFWDVMGSDGEGEWVSPGSLDAQYQNSKEALLEYGDSIIPVSEWGDRPAYTVTHGTGNVLMMLNPAGWARTFLGDAGPGSGLSPHSDGSLPADRGPDGVSHHGGGLHGTDTVSTPTTGPTGDQPNTGSSISGMHDSLTDLQNQLNGNPTTDPGGPPSSPAPGPESPAPSPTPAPDTSPEGTSTSPSEGSTTSNNESTPSRGGEDSSRHTSDPTTQDLREGTTGSGADNSNDPWATSPINDGSTTDQQSPTTPVNDREGTGGNTATHTDGTDSGTLPHNDHRDNGNAATPTEPGGGHGGSGRDDGSGAPPIGPGPDDGASGPRDSGDGENQRGEDGGSLLGPDTPSAPDSSTPTRHTLDETSKDREGRDLVPQDGTRFGDGVTLEPNTRYLLPEGDGQRSTEYITDSDGKIREIRADSDGWGASHPEFLNPRPDMTYVVDDRYTLRTDEHSRTVSAEGPLTFEKNERNEARQGKVGEEGERYFELLNEQIRQDFYETEGRPPEPGEVPQYDKVEYQGGHLIASQFFGIGEDLNMVPMRYDINQNRTDTAFHDRDPTELGGIDGSFRNVERVWRGIHKHGADWHNFNNPMFNTDDSWGAALALNPDNPQIDVKVTNVYDPDMKPIKDPKDSNREILPPPSRVVVNWSLNGVKMRPLEYPNIPPVT